MSVTISPLSASTIVSSVMSLLPGHADRAPAAELAGQLVLGEVPDPTGRRPGLIRPEGEPAPLHDLGEMPEAREERIDVAGVDDQLVAALDRGGDRRRLGARDRVVLDRLADDVGVHVGLEAPARLDAGARPLPRLGVDDRVIGLQVDVAEQRAGELRRTHLDLLLD